MRKRSREYITWRNLTVGLFALILIIHLSFKSISSQFSMWEFLIMLVLVIFTLYSVNKLILIYIIDNISNVKSSTIRLFPHSTIYLNDVFTQIEIWLRPHAPIPKVYAARLQLKIPIKGLKSYSDESVRDLLKYTLVADESIISYNAVIGWKGPSSYLAKIKNITKDIHDLKRIRIANDTISFTFRPVGDFLKTYEQMKAIVKILAP